MSAREWNAGDPEPSDRPPVIDSDDVVWRWTDDTDEGYFTWHQQKLTHYKGNGHPYVTGGVIGYDWPDILEEFGPLREATASEADCVKVVFQ